MNLSSSFNIRAILASLIFIFYFLILKNVYLERERGRERIPSRLHTVFIEPNMGLKPTNRDLTTWAEIKSRTLNRPNHPGGSKMFIYFWERESKQRRGRERGRERIPSKFCTISSEPDSGLEFTNYEIMMSRSLMLNRPRHPDVPIRHFSFSFLYLCHLSWGSHGTSSLNSPY